MLQTEILYVGGEKESYFREAAAEYRKRLGAFCEFSEKTVKDEKLPAEPSEAHVAAALEKEADRLLAQFQPKTYRVALCVEGKELSSQELASLFDDVATRAYRGVTFVIGSSEGLSPRVKEACDLRLSMSRMTFPHRLARVMLLEQIYRAFSICAGMRYHK